MTTQPTRKMRVIEDNFVSLDEKGDKISGVLVTIGKQEVSKNVKPGEAVAVLGKYTLKLETEQHGFKVGQEVSFLGTPTLDQQLLSAKIGKFLEVEFLDKVKTGNAGREVKKWRVAIEE